MNGQYEIVDYFIAGDVEGKQLYSYGSKLQNPFVTTVITSPTKNETEQCGPFVGHIAIHFMLQSAMPQ